MEVERAVEYFLSAKEAEGRTPATITSYSVALYRFAKWLPDGTEVGSIDRFMVREYIAFLRRDGLSDVSVANYIRHLNGWLAWLAKEDIRPKLKVEVPKFNQPDLPILDREDFWKLVNACDPATDKGRRDIAILMFLLDTGVRVGELVSLTTDNVDLKARTARVIGKARRYRTVFFSVETALAMARYDKRRPRGYSPTTFFTGHRDKPLTDWGVRQILERLGEKAGVKGPVNPHAFRHTMATSYLRAGGDPATLQRILGHTDIGTTIRNYSHLVTDDLKAAHEKYSPLVSVMSKRR